MTTPIPKFSKGAALIFRGGIAYVNAFAPQINTMITEEEYLKALQVVKAYQKQVNKKYNLLIGRESLLTHIDMSTRTRNCIIGYIKKYATEKSELEDILATTVEDFHGIFSKHQAKDVRNLGKAVLEEINTVFKTCGLQEK